MAKKISLALAFLLIYMASTIPVGLFLYSLKSKAGLNIFSKTGFHSYLSCLEEQAYKIEINEKGKNLDRKEN
jgi:hypothetical protein